MGFEEEENSRITPAPSFWIREDCANLDWKISSWTLLWQVLSGGVASNQYIRKALTLITDATGLRLLCPPAKFCTDNGVMIAWCVYIDLLVKCWQWIRLDPSETNFSFSFFFFKPGTVLSAWEKGKGYCLQMWMSAMSQSRSTLNQRFHFWFQCKIPIFFFF